jgi:hypothetical protein
MVEKTDYDIITTHAYLNSEDIFAYDRTILGRFGCL